MSFGQMDDQIVQALPKIAFADLQAKQLGDLFDGDDQGQAGDKAHQHRLGEELGDPS